MPLFGPKDWAPEFRNPQTEAGLELQRYLKAVVIVDGEGTIDLNDRHRAYVAIVHSGGSYTPAGVIVVGQIREHDTLEAAFEIMEEHEMKNTDYVKEIQEEWGDDWYNILTEGFDGQVWTFENPMEAVLAIRGDKYAMKYISIEMPERRR